MRSLFLAPIVTAIVLTLPPTAPGLAVTSPWDPFFATQTTITDVSTIAPVSSSSNRAFGIAAGDFDGDGTADLVVGRTDGRVHFLHGYGDGTFGTPVQFPWKLETFNAWGFASGDVDGDGNLDVVWGSNTAGTDSLAVIRVNDGDVRYLAGVGDGTFSTANNYVRSGVTFNAGTLIADVGTDTGAVAVGDVDGDGDLDVFAGTTDGANTTVKLLINSGGGVFGAPTVLISQATTCTTPCSPIYFPAISTQNSPWGLALGDIEGDGDLDLWVGDRALYIYRFLNDGAGNFTLAPPSSPPLPTRPNVYLAHDAFRAAVGFTPSLASGDINGDGISDLVLGLHSGAQTPTTGCGSPTGPCIHDGEILLDLSQGTGHVGFGSVADIGTEARSVAVVDVNGDTYLDIVSGTYEGPVKLLRQLPPMDTDGDGVSDYVDNAPNDANAARTDMNTDGSTNHRDQLDNDFDTVLGDPENPGTWQRLGDPADPDDDNDGVADSSEVCPFVPDAAQGDVDGDSLGDACDPLDNRDDDGDGVANGPVPGDPLYSLALASKIKWSQGDTHFVIRIDALGRFFQNEFTQILTDAATLSAADWAIKCWENYGPGGDDPPDPCGTGEGTPSQTLTLPGGKEVPTTLVTIPKQLWTDPPVVDWINSRNDNPLFELGQHGTYHFNNIPNSDWAALPDRNFYSCEPCGLTEAENFELMKVGYDTLLGNYANKWVAESGATGSSPKIDWSTSAYPLLSFAPPFDTSDPLGREAIAQLGFKAFSASVFEESSAIFTPEGSHHEQFDQFGMFHASADIELDPPDADIFDGDYSAADEAAFTDYLQSHTDNGGLNTWLIEEVEWSGRECNDQPRLTNCNGHDNREDNTIYLPRWQAWMTLLDFAKNYPGGVAMTMGEVALAQAYDNAPTVYNPDQADSDDDGVGDVIDGAALTAADTILSRNVPGSLAATLTNGTGAGISGQAVAFTFDADGDGSDETYNGTTDAVGIASVSVTPTRTVGSATFAVSWDGGHGVTAADTGTAQVADASFLSLDAGNPTGGQVTDSVSVGATLRDSDGVGIAGRTIEFSIGAASASGTTNATGHAQATIVLQGPAAATTLEVAFAGDADYGPSTDSSNFSVLKEDTALTMPDAVGTRTTTAIARATLREADGASLAGKGVLFYVQKANSQGSILIFFGSALTDATGVASIEVPGKYVTTQPRQLRAVFNSDDSFLSASVNASVYRSR